MCGMENQYTIGLIRKLVDKEKSTHCGFDL